MFSKSGFVAAAMMGISAVEAHLRMLEPTPYSFDSLNNSPLAADGSDFPCKLRANAFEDPAEITTASIGEIMPLKLQGSAVHGGGSCQISLTTDKQPSKQSEWMVIKSFEGSCPIAAEGNLSGGSTMTVPSDLNYTIPAGIEPGQYTLAWTWFNRVGNREMYMNCAPITVTSGSASKRSTETVEKRSSSFPPMFVANVNGCITQEGVDIRFPQPGDDVQIGTDSYLAEVGSTACTGTPTFGGAGDSGSGSGSSGSGSSSSAPEPTASVGVSVSVSLTVPTPTADPEPSMSSAPGIFVPTSSAEPAPAPSASAPASSGSSGSSGSGIGALTGDCSPEGEWNCIDGTSFQRCANGQWSESQQMAAGTKCNPGKSQNFAIESTLQPRMLNSMRHTRRAHNGHAHIHA
ncbi:hypothetical protein BDV59DRAFT_188219 [Aspergillus ambiguus]|uniref:lytic polysaccharide monooxygenase AA11 family protein n=1 Tax=Aspergillus ambiguus TaxID=176160 RepID=UPI003CCD171C